MDLNRFNPTQYMWIITKTNKPLGLVRFRRIAPGIVPLNQNLYKLEKQSG
jgi:hypothetical protein